MIKLTCGHYSYEYPEAQIGNKVHCQICDCEATIVALIAWRYSDGQEFVPDFVVITNLEVNDGTRM